MSELNIRPLDLQDVPLVHDYLQNLSSEDLIRMGIAGDRRPSRQKLLDSYQEELEKTPESQSFFSFVWQVDGEEVGYSTLKDIKYGKSGSIHLHMWNSSSRGQGYGGILFCKTVLAFYERFNVETIICEPKADNPMPNKMLGKIGFQLISSREGASSELSAICTLNRFQIDKDTALSFLRSKGF